MGINHSIPSLPQSCVDPLEIDQFWMQQALIQADMAQKNGEIPVGAVVVHENCCIGYAGNSVIRLSDPTAHAEVLALRMAGLRLNNYRLLQSTLYVTLEPCPMCAGAMVHARVGRVVYATNDPRTGAAGEVNSVFNVLNAPELNHRCQVTGGVLAEAAAELLRQFFQRKRNVKK